MTRIAIRISWIAASVLALALGGCCDKDRPLGVREGGGGGPAVVALGTAGTFAVVSGDSVTSTGTTTITGNLGARTTVTGITAGNVTGTIHTGDAASGLAVTDLTAAFNDINARTTNVVAISGDLGGKLLAPGLYATASPINVSGTLTLDALGDSTAIFIIRTASSLTTAAGSRVVLTGSARARNVLWLVGTTATLGANSVFCGTILADQGITVGSGVQVNGRLLTRTGAVALNSDVINVP